jgi:hypothetical protein
MDTRDIGRSEFSRLRAVESIEGGHVWAFEHGARIIECGTIYLDAMRARGHAVRQRIAEIRAERRKEVGNAP